MSEQGKECNICMNYKTSDETMCKNRICSTCRNIMKQNRQDERCPFCRRDKNQCFDIPTNVMGQTNYFSLLDSSSMCNQPIWEGSYIGCELEESN